MFNSNQFFGGGAGDFYPVSIDQSLRFNDNDSAYLSRTFSAGEAKTFTLSLWLKRSNLTSPYIFTTTSGTGLAAMYLYFSANKLTYWDFRQGTNGIVLQTNAVFRDSSAWYHIVLSVDTTQATAANRAKIYVNGEEPSYGITTYQNQNEGSWVNGAITHYISGPSGPLDGYLAEVHFTDGTAYDADAFGELKSGVWVAKTPSVTYGTNGFYLDFATSGDGTTEDLSGNGNNWTESNLTASDVVLDSPTDNFATWNPLDSKATLSDGNLQAVCPSTVPRSGASSISVNSGQWYAEFTIGASTDSKALVGVVTTTHDSLSGSALPASTADNVHYYGQDGRKVVDGTFTSYGSTYTTGDVIGVALDIDNNTVEFFKNNVSQGVISKTFSGDYKFSIYHGSSVGSSTFTANFGQSGFTYTPPTGYLALSTANLPEPTISPADDASPEDYFNTVLYTGTGSSGNVVDTVGFETDFVWIKNRSATASNVLLDRVRGISDKIINTDLANAETTATVFNLVDADGFDIAATGAGTNASGNSYVAWNWKANGTGVSNTVGDIASTVSANTTSGFSIVSYSGSNTAGDTVGHGLNSTPEMVIIKNRSNAYAWSVRHVDLTSTQNLYLSATNAASTVSTTAHGGVGALTSTTFSFISGATGLLNVNASSNNYIAYCFSEVEGFSKFGSYTGNGSTDGPFVYTGFRPAFVMVKSSTNATASWQIHDNTRNYYNPSNSVLFPNLSNAEFTGSVVDVDFLSNGFKARGTNTNINASGETYIYACFSENPFKYSNAR